MKAKKRKTRRPTARRFNPPACKNFTGYKPCFPGTVCLEQCAANEPLGTRILLVNLDAMGNVLATTSILPAIKRKYPVSTITWITEKNTLPLLQGNPYLDAALAWDPENWLILRQREFDLVLNVDKSQRSAALTMETRAGRKMGFGINGNGHIVPLNPEAWENYRLGLDDHEKFRVNKKTVPELQCVELGLPYGRDEYVFRLSAEEEKFCRGYAEEHGITEATLVVGFNTGCSELYPNKKMTIDQHVTLIERIAEIPDVTILLLGGPEDTLRNAEIARRTGSAALNTPTTEGVRRGACYENLCDVVISGDSFGMHIAIALKKYVIAWFGVSCWTEIDLFERGRKLIPEGLACSPCWKKVCPYGLECIAMIDIDRIVREVSSLADKHRASHGAP